jgi:hypothetical protein
MRLLLLALCLLATSPPGVAAGVYPLDDSATVVHGGALPMGWRADHAGPRAGTTLDGRTTVDVVLDTRAWIGKPARVYMRLAPGPVRFVVQWNTTGRLKAGRIEPGQRVLVYDGTISAAALSDRLEVVVSADGREYAVPQRLRFSYEIEVGP